MHPGLTKNLRSNLNAVLSGNANSRQIDSVIAVCHALATSLLMKKKAAGTLLQFHDINCSDLAYDCIAELFSEHNAVPHAQLKAYFRGIPHETLGDDEILVYLSRLVFSKVNEGIFRCYHDVDPSLAKILRAIKRTVQSMKLFLELDHWNEPCIAPNLCDTLEHLPPIDREMFERQLSSHIIGMKTIPDMLSGLSLYLREEEEHSRIVPMITVALVFRSLFAKHAIHQEGDTVAPENFVVQDATGIVQGICSEMEDEHKPKYVGKGKVDEEIYGKYFDVIQQSILARTVGGDGEDFSFYEALQQNVPGLSKEEYAKLHKSKLEYLHKLTYERVVGELKRGELMK